MVSIISEISLRDFQFWSGAICRAEALTGPQLDQIESVLEDLYPDGVSETSINDLFWFEEDTLADWLGFGSFEELERFNNGEEEEEEEEEEE